MKMQQRVILASVLLFLLSAAASASVIDSITILGHRLTITGSGFTGTPLTVTFNGSSIPIVSSSTTQIVVMLKAIPESGSYRVVVKAGSASTFAYVTAPAAPAIVARVALKGQTATVPITTIFTPTTDGLYLISAYLIQSFSTSACTTSCGEINLNFQWTDDGGTHRIDTEGHGEFYTPFMIHFVDCAASGFAIPACEPAFMQFAPSQFPNLPVGAFPVRINAGTPLQYSVTAFTAISSGLSYDLFIAVERLM